VGAGAVAPRGGNAAAAAGAAYARSPAAHSSGAGGSGGGSSVPVAEDSLGAIPCESLDKLIGQRLRGSITVLSSKSESSGKGRSVPHGFVNLHHVGNQNVLFLISQFRELAGHPPNADVHAAALRIAHGLSIGDVLEFTLTSDVVLGLSAEDIRLVATIPYEQVLHERRQLVAQEQAQEPMPPQLTSFASSLEPLYVLGTRLSRIENKTWEFKSLTRSLSDRGRSVNMFELADKYLNGFVNSSGGVLLFGVEDDGEVQGLPLNAKQRDNICTHVSSLLQSCEPAVDPRHYAIRFIPVYRLYKSSWAAQVGDDPDGSYSLGLMQAQRHQNDPPSAMCSLMCHPEAGDRVEDTLRFVVAMLIQASPEHVVWTRTKQRKIWVRSLAVTAEMTMEQGVERDRAARERLQLAASKANKANEEEMRQLQREREELQRQRLEMQHSQKDEVKRLVMEQMMAFMAQHQQMPAAAPLQPAAAAAVAAPAISVPAPALPVSAPAPSVSIAPPPVSAASASASVSVAPPSPVQMPAGLLEALMSMQFAEDAIVAAVERLHAHPPSPHLFAAGAPTAPQVAAVIDALLGVDVSPTPRAPISNEGSREGSPNNSPRRQQQEGASAAAAAAASPPAAASSSSQLSAQQLSELSAIERASEHIGDAGIPRRSSVSSSRSNVSADDEGVAVECAICGESMPWETLEEHELACQRQQAQQDEERDHQIALKLQQQLK
jgi:hypothetical protein